jgi:lysozyme
MLSNEEIIQRLVFHEGCVLKPYKCTEGFLTIGVGRNLETNPLTEYERKVCGDYMHGITKNAAFYLLRNDIDRVVEECAKAFPFWANLDNERQYALLDMVFQLGVAGVKKFKKMLAAMGVGNWKEAAEQCLDSRYAQQTPNRAKRIAKTIECGRFEI